MTRTKAIGIQVIVLTLLTTICFAPTIGLSASSVSVSHGVDVPAHGVTAASSVMYDGELFRYDVVPDPLMLDPYDDGLRHMSEHSDAVSVSGTISLPDGHFAPEDGLRLQIASGRYYSHVTIAAHDNSADYTVNVPANSSVRINYWLLETDYPGTEYARLGYYSTSGTQALWAMGTEIVVGTEPVAGIDFSIAPGKVVSGVLSLPAEHVAPPGGLHVIMGYQVGTSGNYSFRYTIPEHMSYVTYNMVLPPDVYAITYSLSHITNNPEHSYVKRGYYSQSGTVFHYDHATLIDLVEGPVLDVDFTLVPGRILAGEVHAPTSSTVPDRLHISVVANSPAGGQYWHDITMENGTTTPFRMIVREADDYIVNYGIADNQGFIARGYFNVEGTVSSQSDSSLIRVQDDVQGIVLTLLPSGQNLFIIHTIDPPRTTPSTELRLTIMYPTGSMTQEYKINQGDWINYTGPILVTENGYVYTRAVMPDTTVVTGGITIDSIVSPRLTLRLSTYSNSSFSSPKEQFLVGEDIWVAVTIEGIENVSPTGVELVEFRVYYPDQLSASLDWARGEVWPREDWWSFNHNHVSALDSEKAGLHGPSFNGMSLYPIIDEVETPKPLLENGVLSTFRIPGSATATTGTYHIEFSDVFGHSSLVVYNGEVIPGTTNKTPVEDYVDFVGAAITLSPLGGFSGTVRDPLGTLSGVSVALSQGGVPGETTISIHDGSFAARVTPGSYVLTFRKTGYIQRTVEVTVATAVINLPDVWMYLIGDANLDGVVNTADLVTINLHALGIDRITDQLGLLAADVNGDGIVNAADMVPINRHTLGIELLFHLHPRVQDYNTVYSAELATFNYLESSTVTQMQVAMNAVDGMVEFDNFGVIRPAAAKALPTIAPDGLVYTFQLREGMMWHNHKGEEVIEVVAQDFVDAVKHVLDPATASFSAHHIRGIIKDADAYFLGLASNDHPEISFDHVGIKALDRYTVQYTLEQATPWFLSTLTHTVYKPVNGAFLVQVGDRFGTSADNMLYSGPYILSAFEPYNYRQFVRNENYWDKDKVHIKNLTYFFNPEAGALAPELFYRGEISSTGIPLAIIESWMENPDRKDIVIPNPVSSWNFWYAFNFNPQFAEEYEPENWRKAVQNINFRKAFFHGIDRAAAHMTIDPYNPERQLKNTFTSPGFVSVEGVEYTMLPALEKFTTNDPFQPELAKAYRDIARTELEAIGVTFPVKVKWPFSTGSADATHQAQVIKQQLEDVLGGDFIDFTPVGYNPVGFLDVTRRSGNYALSEVNWGATYIDPYAYTPPFHTGDPMSYTDISIVAGDAYMTLLEAAHAETVDLDRRHILFSEAEAYLIENALAIPYRGGGGGYGASYIQPFTIPYAPAGLANLSFKYAWIRETPVTSSEFFELERQWGQERLIRLGEQGQ